MALYGSRNKYGNVRQTYNGFNYDSRAEAVQAAELDLRMRAKDIKGWDRQFGVEILAPDGTLICKHRVDFRVEHNDGSFELVEVKGFDTADWRLKRKLLEKLWLPDNPGYRYSVVRV